MNHYHETNDKPFRAFPSQAIDDRLGGMSLRDWFAGQALAGVLANATLPVGLVAEICAQNAYLIADAMMAERVKEGE